MRATEIVNLGDEYDIQLIDMEESDIEEESEGGLIQLVDMETSDDGLIELNIAKTELCKHKLEIACSHSYEYINEEADNARTIYKFALPLEQCETLEQVQNYILAGGDPNVKQKGTNEHTIKKFYNNLPILLYLLENGAKIENIDTDIITKHIELLEIAKKQKMILKVDNWRQLKDNYKYIITNFEPIDISKIIDFFYNECVADARKLKEVLDFIIINSIPKESAISERFALMILMVNTNITQERVNILKYALDNGFCIDYIKHHMLTDYNPHRYGKKMSITSAHRFHLESDIKERDELFRRQWAIDGTTHEDKLNRIKFYDNINKLRQEIIFILGAHGASHDYEY